MMPTIRESHLMDDEEHFQMFLGLIRTGKPFGLACKACRITRQAMNVYLDRHPDRAAMYVDAEMEATEVIEQVLYEEARARQKWAVLTWLERRDSERWAPAAKEDSGRRIVLDPAALKGMLSEGHASVVEDDEVSVTLPPAADVEATEVKDLEVETGQEDSRQVAEVPPIIYLTDPYVL